ncbi:hypothetical protein V8B55DRAFT_1367058 [Mucor lusitanicus]|uniref:RING-type domain-containing protein n=2 Tax=Mucor circinelloides f. lusitanicus TaxID=29924 RepID=A0A168N996_MUCCL|nr:hypothetical protein FB192DRAFT_1136197 [Mucor lusitanicus]OAD05974.1 hypothetical protein MUCCIDRAFT_78961 [Mucor lusitanicus CBS 277.49]
MKTMWCNLCSNVGKEPLVAIVNCGHVFDVDCIEEYFTTSLRCPICCQGTSSNDNTETSRWCRVFVSLKGDCSSSEFSKLKDDLAQDAIVIDELRKKLTCSENQAKSAEGIRENLLRTCGENKVQLDAIKKELADAKAIHLEDVQKISTYVEQIMDLTLAKKTHANEVDDLKKKNDTLARDLQSQRDKCTAMAKRNNYEKEYFDLKKSFDDVVAKQKIINSKYIEIAIADTSNPDAVRSHIQGLEKQLSISRAKENKLFADVKTLAKKKADIFDDRHRIFLEKCKLSSERNRLIRENDQLREKLGCTTAKQASSEWEEYASNHTAKDKDIQKQLKIAKKNASKWIAENQTLQQDLKASEEKIKTLEGSLNSITAEKVALQKAINETSNKNQVYQGSSTSASTTGWSTPFGEDLIFFR